MNTALPETLLVLSIWVLFHSSCCILGLSRGSILLFELREDLYTLYAIFLRVAKRVFLTVNESVLPQEVRLLALSIDGRGSRAFPPKINIICQ